MSITAQEWLDELVKKADAAIMPPYYLRRKRFIGEEEEEYYVSNKEDYVICRMKLVSTEPNNAAYIVAACNAVPRLVEMVKLAASLLECPYDDEKCPHDEDNTVSCAHCKAQRLYDMTEQR